MDSKGGRRGSGLSRRDNFSQSVINILFKRAGGKCCRCHAPTFGPVTNNPNKYRNIGQAAHIAAAAPGGPRFDPHMSTEERTSAANGLWLCSNCHDQVDRDVDEFTTRVLKEMKRKAETRARQEIGVATPVKCHTHYCCSCYQTLILSKFLMHTTTLVCSAHAEHLQFTMLVQCYRNSTCTCGSLVSRLAQF